MDRCVGELFAIACCSLIEIMIKSGIFGVCCDCCAQEANKPEEGKEKLITNEPEKAELNKSAVSQKVYNTTGIGFNNKMYTGFSSSYN